MDIRRQEPEEFRPRHRYFISAVIVIFLIFFVRLLYLQVIKGHELRFLSENNRIRLIKIPAVRGMIMDRKGRVLVDSRPAFNVMVTPEDVDDLKGFTQKLSRFLHLSPDEIAYKIEHRDPPPFQPVLIKRDISWEELSSLKTHRLDLPGVEIQIEPIRTYPYGNIASHVLGYVGEINKDELKENKKYQMGDWMGKYGVEMTWEEDLRGINGGRQVEVDAAGKEIRLLKEVPPVQGRPLYLTIDLDLQRYGEELLGKRSGAIIAMDPLTGEILAFCSSPSFQPAPFAEGISAQEWEKLASDPLHPLQNRGIQGLYPPGSVFKIVTSAAGLEEEVITSNTSFNCTGIYYLGKRGYQCWRAGGHGVTKFYRGVVESCDIYFYNVGERLGVERLSRYARGFGLGRPTGIDLPGEKAGLVPTEAWKQERLGVRWYTGETISLAIGQSYLLVTPLQVLNLMSAVANGGALLKPQIAKRVEDLDKKVVEEYPTEEIGRLPISPKTLEELRVALVGVTKEDSGTGRGARIDGMEVAGKTGTAQVVRLKGTGERPRAEDMPYELRDHAWFVAYVAAHTPLAVVVLVEHGGHGGAAAVPLAREMIKKYLSLRRGEK
ncbi:MAG: penicillin-binding protein 2 [Deltaproteobacteria bacterium RBG_13_52_11]|nr:MAG: penicillin-binding protein 2 [Deltaproteobacteria bacterium RBG_13_52_11]